MIKPSILPAESNIATYWLSQSYCCNLALDEFKYLRPRLGTPEKSLSSSNECVEI